MLNGRDLLPNQREKPRTERCPPCTVENARQHTEPPKRQPQSAGSTDKVQPRHGRLAVLAAPEGGTRRPHEDSQTFTGANCIPLQPPRVVKQAKRMHAALTRE